MKAILLCSAALAMALPCFGGVSLDSPVFATRNLAHVQSLDREGFQYLGLKTLEGGMAYGSIDSRAVDSSSAQAPAQNPASLSVSSVCLASGCAGSICLGSACAGSICFGSACGGSVCGSSACVSTACGGSVCVSSACGGSVCVGSVCIGSACVGSVCTGNCGRPESFPLVSACDYQIQNNSIQLSLGVTAPCRLNTVQGEIMLKEQTINHINISGEYTSVSFDEAASDGLNITLIAADGSSRQLRLRQS